MIHFTSGLPLSSVLLCKVSSQTHTYSSCGQPSQSTMLHNSLLLVSHLYQTFHSCSNAFSIPPQHTKCISHCSFLLVHTLVIGTLHHSSTPLMHETVGGLTIFFITLFTTIRVYAHRATHTSPTSHPHYHQSIPSIFIYTLEETNNAPPSFPIPFSSAAIPVLFSPHAYKLFLSLFEQVCAPHHFWVSLIPRNTFPLLNASITYSPFSFFSQFI